MQRQTTAILGVAVMAAAVLSGCGTSDAGGGGSSIDVRWVMGTSPTGGTYYPLGTAIAQVARGEEPGLQITPQVSASSDEENMRLIAAGDIHLGWVGGSLLNTLKERGEDLSPYQIVFAGYPSVIHWVVSADSGITSPGDYRGEAVAIGNPASGMEHNNLETLQAGWDLARSDIDAQNLHVEPGLQAVRDGRVAGVNIPTGVPVTSIIEACEASGLKLLSLTGEEIERITTALPYWSLYTIEKGTYSCNENEDVQTIGQASYLIARNDVDQRAINRLTEIVFTNLDQLGQSVAQAKAFSPAYAVSGQEFMDTIGVEWASGAKDYFTSVDAFE